LANFFTWKRMNLYRQAGNLASQSATPELLQLLIS